MGRKIDPLVVVALTLILVATVSCEPMLVVRVTTQVYEDGSMARQVEVVGRDDTGQVPTESEWLAETAGVRLADPEAWARLDETPGRVAAEGFFKAPTICLPCWRTDGTAPRGTVVLAHG